jgi:hypothetical protein
MSTDVFLLGCDLAVLLLGERCVRHEGRRFVPLEQRKAFVPLVHLPVVRLSATTPDCTLLLTPYPFSSSQSWAYVLQQRGRKFQGFNSILPQSVSFAFLYESGLGKNHTGNCLSTNKEQFYMSPASQGIPGVSTLDYWTEFTELEARTMLNS